MRLTAQMRRPTVLVVALLAAAAVVSGAPSVTAGPRQQAVPTVDPDGDSKTLKTLRDQLDAAAAGYIEAKTRHDASKAAEGKLKERMTASQAELDGLMVQVREIAAMSYRTGRLGTVTALLDSTSPDNFLARAGSIEALAMHEDTQLNQLRRVRRDLTQQQDRLFAEIRQQAELVATMDKRKKDAERALASAGGGQVSGGVGASRSAAAKPAPRNSDGTWPRESCSADDPTTTGCLTPRTLHALQQTKNAGFTRFVACFRSGDGGEHPKGRACDFAAAPNGFGGVATGGERTYGNNLAAYYIANWEKLGVMYVIWFKQIWMPSTGWRTYNSGGGDPASDHTNHVHLSVV